MKNILNLDVNLLEFDEDGVKDFFWPVSLEQQKKARKSIHRNLHKLLTKYSNNPGYSLLEVNVVSLINLFSEMLTASLINKGALEKNYQIEYGPDYKYTKILLEGYSSINEPVLNQLIKGPPELSMLKLPLRFSRDLIKSRAEGIPRRVFRKIEMEKDILTMGTHKLIWDWNKNQERSSIYKRQNYWFSKIDRLKVSLNTEENNLLAELKGLLDQIFQENSLVVPSVFLKYFNEFSERSFLFTKQRLENLRTSQKIPVQLWLNTGGNIYARLLSFAVRERGGEVTGFDHARGITYLEDLSDYILKELLISNKFVVYSSKQAQHLRDFIDRSDFKISCEILC